MNESTTSGEIDARNSRCTLASNHLNADRSFFCEVHGGQTGNNYFVSRSAGFVSSYGDLNWTPGVRCEQVPPPLGEQHLNSVKGRENRNNENALNSIAQKDRAVQGAPRESNKGVSWGMRAGMLCGSQRSGRPLLPSSGRCSGRRLRQGKRKNLPNK
jgi:hypothetical protein